MSVISKLAEVDPVFREVVTQLYPELDPRELWDLSKSMPDQSAVHINGAAQRKKERRIAQTGLAATGVAGIGGAHALAMTGKQAVKQLGGPRLNYVARHAATKEAGVLTRVSRKLPGGVKGAALAGTAGWLGLHATEMVGDALGARAQLKTIKATTPPKQPKVTISHAAPTAADFAPIIQARKNGVISTERALQLIDDLSKGLIWDSKALNGFKTTASLAGYLKQAKDVQAGDELAQKVGRAASNGRRAMAVAGTATTATVGAKAGRRAERRKLATSLVGKSAEVDYGFTGEISKVDPDKRQVFGWCSLSTIDGQPVVDLQNDYVPIEEMERSAYEYVIKSRKGGDMHSRLGEEPLHTSDMIESMIVTPEKLRAMGLPEEVIAKTHTGWWVGYQVNDETQWQKVKNGERVGFSIHGKGQRVEKVLS